MAYRIEDLIMESKTIIFKYIQKLKKEGHSKRFIINEIMPKYDLQQPIAHLYVLQNGFTNIGDHPKYW